MANPILISLNNTDYALTDPSEDIRCFKVLDESGEEIGEVTDLLVDEEEKKVRFIEVSSGGILGIGATRIVVPVEAIERIKDEVVYINRAREDISRAPRYDPEVADEEYWSSVYGYYGYGPYWGAGYMYPGMPFIR